MTASLIIGILIVGYFIVKLLGGTGNVKDMVVDVLITAILVLVLMQFIKI